MKIKEKNEFINKIICGDSREVLKKIDDNIVDIIVTSPPYNFNIDYDNINDDVNWEEYFYNLNLIWEECFRVLKHGGRICIVVQPHYSKYIPTHHKIVKQLEDLGFIWRNEIIWNKSNFNCKHSAFGSFKSPSAPYLKCQSEFVEILCKGDKKKAGDKGKIDITKEEFIEWVRNNIWNIAPETRKIFEHNAMFPEKLIYRLLKLFSYQGDLMLDPFNGAGTSTAVAHALSRRFIGIEMSEKYCSTAQERLN